MIRPITDLSLFVEKQTLRACLRRYINQHSIDTLVELGAGIVCAASGECIRNALLFTVPITGMNGVHRNEPGILGPKQIHGG
jgi:hypothetical protein